MSRITLILVVACSEVPEAIPLLEDVPASTDVDVAAPVGAPIAFEDRTDLLQIELRGTYGVAFVDTDEDGWPDVTLATERGVRLLRNRKTHFEDVSDDTGLGAAFLPDAHGVAYADLDGDQDLDLFVTRFAGRDALFINEDGFFHDRSVEWGLPAEPVFSHSATIGDLDGDRDLDVYVATGADYRINPGRSDSTSRPDRVYRNEGGHFVESAGAMGLEGPLETGDSFIGLLVDFDGDADLDVFSIHDLERSRFYTNDGQGHFTEKGTEWVTDAPAGLMGLDVADVDGDGLLDMFGTDFGQHALFVQRPDRKPRFHDVFGEALGAGFDPTAALTGWGCALIDVDNDGDVDPFSIAASDSRFLGPERRGTPHFGRLVLLENRSQGANLSLVDVSDEAGPTFAQAVNGYGLARGDFDRDGAEDVILGAQAGSQIEAGTVMRPILLRNSGTSRGHSLMVRLFDRASPNTHAVGARVDIEVQGRRQARVVTAGASFLSAYDYGLHFGLGSSTTVPAITVTWPDGEREVIPGAFGGEIVLERGTAPKKARR